ncbi:MAG: sulfotransferase, partial [Actinobacteria bacterium]|nr:sulfotransferase [Actinomycetota bacterium]
MSTQLTHPDWVRRLNLFGDVVGDPRRIVSLDPDELLGLARAMTGCDDLGEDDWPGWEETYRRTVTAIDAEADLHVLGRVLTRGETLRALATWLRLQRMWSERPEVLAEPIAAPVFVVGPPRSGTTILHELLALDPQLRAPLAWEALYPLRGMSAERRRELAECEQELWADIHPEFMTMHELASYLPCECHHFVMYDFASPYW